MDHRNPGVSVIESDGSEQIKDWKHLIQGPQYPVVVDIRDDESTIGERVDHVSSLFIDFDSVERTCSGYLYPVGISGEFPDPPELDLEF